MSASILIVDDAAFMRNLFREMLKTDFQIQGTAKNGVEAVELCREHEPDFVIMDLAMPIRDGIDATAKIKEEGLSAKIIVCGTVGQEAEIKQAFDAGADGYLTKPCQKPMVVETIESVRAA